MEGFRKVGTTDEIAAVEADDDGMFAWPDGFGGEDVSGDGVVVDGLVCDVVNVERVESLFDGCDQGRIHVVDEKRKGKVKPKMDNLTMGQIFDLFILILVSHTRLR